MLGLLLLYWIGKYFYRLAEEFNKNKWLFAILGIIVYYGATFVFGVITVIIGEIVSPGFMDTVNDTLLGILMIPFGILTSYVFYILLEKSWKAKNVELINLIADNE